jgi:hypothetical protein
VFYQAHSGRRLCNRAAEGVGLHEVREAPPPVDLDHRNPFAIGRLERLVTGDVDLAETEVQLLSYSREDLPGAVAQVAPRGGIQDDGDYG